MIAFPHRSCSTSILVVVLAVSARANETSFGPTLVTVPASPTRIAAGDLDGDGRVDLVSAHTDGTLSALRSLGAGNFAPPVACAAPTAASEYVGIALADVDGDTDLDVIALNGVSAVAASVCMWRNLGNFAFAAPIEQSVGSPADAIAVGDVNGDALPDVVVVAAGSTDALVLFLNSGSGVFAQGASVSLGTGVDARDVGLADVDGDSDLDAVTANANGTLAVSINTNGAFAAPVFYSSGLSKSFLTLADFDGDGDIDAVTANSARQVVLLRNSGGAFGSPSTIGVTRGDARCLAHADLDADGDQDVVLGDALDRLTSFPALGTGAFSAPIEFYSGGGAGIALADVDGDQRPDALVPAKTAARIGEFLGDGRGGFGRTHLEFGAPVWSFVVEDVNGDQRLDLVVGVSEGWWGLRFRLGLAGGGFAAESSFPTSFSPQEIEPGNVNDDGFADVFTPAYGRVVFPGNAQTGLSSQYSGLAANSFPGSVTNVVFGDFNGDGRTDLAFTGHNSYSTIPPVFYTTNEIHTASLTTPSLQYFEQTFVASNQVLLWIPGDLNADGIEDLLMTGTNKVTLSNGAGGFTMTATSSNFAGVTAVGDVNGDGFGDAVNFTSGQYMPGNGAGVFGAPVPSNIVGPVTFADFTGDGRQDAIGAGEVVRYYEGTSSGLAERGQLTGVPNVAGAPYIPAKVRFIDMDGDGRRDLVYGSSNPSGITVVRNRGAASGPVAYCKAKTTSNGCAPTIAWSGVPGASATSGFTISCTNVINNAPGLLVYSPSGRMKLPFQGGTLCVGPSIFRAPIALSGGNPGPMDCSGAYALDFNAFAHGLAGGVPLPTLVVPGTAVTAQWYGRDAFSIGGASLSNAIDFVVGP